MPNGFVKGGHMVKTRGMTLLEIMAALLILAFAFIPIIGVIGTGATDTDVTNSYIFAQTAARSILENLLDNVPFECVHMETGSVADFDGSNSEDHVALFENSPTFDVASYLTLLGNPGTADKFGRGNLKDGRGVTYAVKLLVFPVEGLDSSTPDPSQEITFNYQSRPEFENSKDTSTPPKANWYTDQPYVQNGVARPYDYVTTPTPTNAFLLGVTAGTLAAERYCLMKKFLLRIRWHVPANRERFLEIYTAKANLSKQD